ncbi:MAG TPA: hypothetical protein VFP46_02155 [Candidatus Paceibacterota bacterium]|nr:hypothetical protein [Candidatus Paceibacterota bacterium]
MNTKNPGVRLIIAGLILPAATIVLLYAISILNSIFQLPEDGLLGTLVTLLGFGVEILAVFGGVLIVFGVIYIILSLFKKNPPSR